MAKPARNDTSLLGGVRGLNFRLTRETVLFLLRLPANRQKCPKANPHQHTEKLNHRKGFLSGRGAMLSLIHI